MKPRQPAPIPRDVDVFDVDVAGEAFVVISVPASGVDIPRRRLTAAEASVAEDAANGLSNAAIAKRRGTSARTVANQLASIYRKLDVAGRSELVALLLRARDGQA